MAFLLFVPHTRVLTIAHMGIRVYPTVDILSFLWRSRTTPSFCMDAHVEMLLYTSSGQHSRGGTETRRRDDFSELSKT